MRTEVLATEHGNIVRLFADTKKELTLTFFRVQEYYESQKPELFRKSFSVMEFLEAMMTDDGVIEYFSDWDGFNVPDELFNRWISEQSLGGFTKQENALIDSLLDLDRKTPYYVIGAMKGDKGTLEHEMSHAYYYLNPEYIAEANNLLHIFETTYPDEYKQFVHDLKELGYADDVIDDETVAWMAATNKREFNDTFYVEYAKLEPLIKRFRKLLRKYNK